MSSFENTHAGEQNANGIMLEEKMNMYNCCNGPTNIGVKAQ